MTTTSTFTMIDPRQIDADREFSRWVQRGVPPKVVAALLPALVSGPIGTARAAEAFLSRAAIGNDLSEAGQRAEAVLLAQAQSLHSSLVSTGGFRGTENGIFVTPKGRYNLTDEQVNSEMDNTTHGDAAARRNARVLAAAEIQPSLDKDYGPGTVVADDGKVYRWRNGAREHVDTLRFTPGQPNVSDLSPWQQGQHVDANLSNEDSDEASDYGEGVNKPFFA